MVSNPPFSQIREYLDCILSLEKEFIIIAPNTAIGYKNIFKYIKSGDIKLGNRKMNKAIYFNKPDGTKIRMNNVVYLTNMKYKCDTDIKTLEAKYDPLKYQMCDNIDAVNIDKCADVPIDYDGLMTVPLTFLEYLKRYNFKIVGFRYGTDDKDIRVDGKEKFQRIIIKK